MPLATLPIGVIVAGEVRGVASPDVLAPMPLAGYGGAPKEGKRTSKGTEIEVVAHYDSSPQNRFNSDPTRDVRWGRPDVGGHMMIGFWGTVADRGKP